MPTRSPFHELQRFLKNLRQPLYVVDDERRIVYLNDACAAWLGVEAADLLGRTCRYQSGDPDPLAAAADALCPPPEVFQGQRVKSLVAKSNTDEATNQRVADFLPLAGENGECVGVLAIVSETTDLPDAGASADSTESARLHVAVQRFRQSLRGWYRLDRLAGQSAAMGARAGASKTRRQNGCGGVDRRSAGKRSATRRANDPRFERYRSGNVRADFVQRIAGGIAALDRWGDQRTLPAIQNEPPTTILLADIDALPSKLHHEFAKWLVAEPKNLRVLAILLEPLVELARRGAFRAELAELLGTLIIDIPPLARRREDIPLLAQMLLEEVNGQSAKQLRGFSPEMLDRLVQYDWPGEVDELAATVRESCAAAEGVEVASDNLPKRLRLAAEAARFPRKPVEPIELEKLLARIETELIQRALQQAKGNKSQAAKLLGLNRPRLYRRMVQLGLESAESSDAEVVQFIEDDASG